MDKNKPIAIPLFKNHYVSVANYFYKNYFDQSLYIAQKFADAVDNLIFNAWSSSSKIAQYKQEWSVIKGNCVNYKIVNVYPPDYLSLAFDGFFLESRDAILNELKKCDEQNKYFNTNWLRSIPTMNKLKKDDISLYCT